MQWPGEVFGIGLRMIAITAGAETIMKQTRSIQSGKVSSTTKCTATPTKRQQIEIIPSFRDHFVLRAWVVTAYAPASKPTHKKSFANDNAGEDCIS